MADTKCFHCGAPATRERSVVVRSVETGHRDLFPRDRRFGRDGHHHHHTEVVRELRPICDTCDAKIAAQEAAVAKVAVGVFKGMAALFIFITVVALALFGVAGVLIWKFFQAVH